MSVARALLSLVFAVCLMADTNPAPPTDGGRVGESLTGLLLVATPNLPDPHFAKSVVFIVRHNEQGAFGIVVNKVLGTGPAGEVLREFGVDEPDAVGDLCAGAAGAPPAAPSALRSRLSSTGGGRPIGAGRRRLLPATYRPQRVVLTRRPARTSTMPATPGQTARAGVA